MWMCAAFRKDEERDLRIDNLNVYRKLTCAVQNSEQCFRRNSSSWLYAPAAPATVGTCTTEHRGPRGNSSVASMPSGVISMIPTFLVKKAGRSGGGFERPGWRSPPGRRVNFCYIDDGLLVVGAAVGCVPSPTVLVIRRTSTRRLSARPLEVLFDSTGLSLPRPIT